MTSTFSWRGAKKGSSWNILDTTLSAFSDFNENLSNFRHPSLSHTNLKNASSFVQQFWTDPRGQGQRTSRGSQGSPATVAPPAMGHHSPPKSSRRPQHYFGETLILSITRSVDRKCKRGKQSSSVRHAVRRDTRVEHLWLRRLKEMQHQESTSSFPNTPIKRAFTSHILVCVCVCVFVASLRKNGTSTSAEKQTLVASHCLRTGILCTRANGRLSGLPNASLTLGGHA